MKQRHLISPAMLILPLVLLLFGCGKEETTSGKIGESFDIVADIPEAGDPENFDFDWMILQQPDASLVGIQTMIVDENPSHLEFIPDAGGGYEFQVSVSQYGDELSSQTFLFDISDEMAEVIEEYPSDVPAYEDTSEDWLNETIEEPEMNTPPESTPLEPSVTPSPKPRVKTPTPGKTASKKPVPGSSIPAERGRYTIQVASRKQQEDAERVVADLIEKGFDAYIQKAYFKETDEVWFRIRVGNYTAYSMAVNVAKTLEESEGFDTWVDKVRLEN